MQAVPQETVPPQPSGTVPQFDPPGHMPVGVHPHLLATPPPPQVLGAMQAGPQKMMLPQPSGTVPQSDPAGHIPVGLHPHMFGVPPPPQV